MSCTCYVTGTGSVNLKNEKKNCRWNGFLITLTTLKSPSPSFCLHFSGSQENFSDIAASMTFHKICPYPAKNKQWLHPHSLLLLFSLTAKKGKVTKKRATRLSAVQMLERKNERKADLKEKELKLKYEELQLQNKKFEQEAAERNERLKLELEEKRVFLQFLKEKM